MPPPPALVAPSPGDVLVGSTSRTDDPGAERYVFLVERASSATLALGLYCLYQPGAERYSNGWQHVRVTRHWCMLDHSTGRWLREFPADGAAWFGLAVAYVRLADGELQWRADVGRPEGEGIRPPPFDVAVAFAEHVVPRIVRARQSSESGGAGGGARSALPLLCAGAALWWLSRSV